MCLSSSYDLQVVIFRNIVCIFLRLNVPSVQNSQKKYLLPLEWNMFLFSCESTKCAFTKNKGKEWEHAKTRGKKTKKKTSYRHFSCLCFFYDLNLNYTLRIFNGLWSWSFRTGSQPVFKKSQTLFSFWLEDICADRWRQIFTADPQRACPSDSRRHLNPGRGFQRNVSYIESAPWPRPGGTDSSGLWVMFSGVSASSAVLPNNTAAPSEFNAVNKTLNQKTLLTPQGKLLIL